MNKLSLQNLLVRLLAVARYRYFFYLTLMFFGVWLICAGLVQWLESGVNAHTADPYKTLYFLLVTMTTSGDSQIVPITLGGRLVMGFALLASKLLTALLCALAAALLIERKVREEMGMLSHDLKDHVVIMGWNLKGPQLIATLRATEAWRHTPVAIVAAVDNKPVDDPLVYFTKASHPVRGDALERACVTRASVIVTLADYSERHHSDSLTAINCMLARNACPRAQIISELLDPSQRVYLETAGANVIVGIGEVGGFLLAEAVVGNADAKRLLSTIAKGIHERKA
jgi:voltage-gated potassium channel